jgi:hypothetical protein
MPVHRKRILLALHMFNPTSQAYRGPNAGGALVAGGGVIALTLEKRAIFHLIGRHVGLIADLDPSGTPIRLPELS